MRTRIIISGLLALIVTACGSQGVKDELSQPAWVMGESTSYPRTSYLTGVGEGDSITVAKSRARAEIAKVFEVDIRAQSSDSSQYESSQLGSLTTESGSLSVSQQLQTQTKQLLRGVETPKVWQDPASKRYYALAILARVKSAAQIRQEISGLDKSTDTLISQANGSQSLFKKIRLSNQAIQLQIKRDMLAKQLAVISATGNTMPSKWAINKMFADRNELVSRVTLSVQATGSEPSKVKTALANALANAGFTVAEQADYRVVADLDSTPLSPKGDWFYSKGVLVLSIFGEGNKNLGGHNWEFKVSSTQAGLTDLRVLEKTRSILDTEAKTKIFKSLEAAGF